MVPFRAKTAPFNTRRSWFGPVRNGVQIHHHLWWSRRVLPPGPLRLFYAAVYRHSRVEPDDDAYRTTGRPGKEATSHLPATISLYILGYAHPALPLCSAIDVVPGDRPDGRAADADDTDPRAELVDFRPDEINAHGSTPSTGNALNRGRIFASSESQPQAKNEPRCKKVNN